VTPEFVAFDVHQEGCLTCQRERRCVVGVRLALEKIAELHDEHGRPLEAWELEAEAAVAAAVRLVRRTEGSQP
jgi:hypothetical protein